MEVLQSIILVIIWVFSSYLGSFASGWTGGLSVWLMILSGIPPQITKATYQIWLLFNAVAGIRNFMKSWHIPKKYLLGSVIAAFLWGFIWSNLMVATPNDILQKLAGIGFLIFLCITFLRKKYQKTEKTTKPLNYPRIREYITYLGQFLFSILAGYIPWSAGGFIYIVYTEAIRIDILQYKALWRFTSIAIVAGAIYPVIQAGLLHLDHIIPFSLGMYIGGYFGSKHLIKMWNDFVQKIVYTSIFFLSLYLIFS